MSYVRLHNSHIYLKNAIVKQIFEEINFAYVVYQKEQNHILVTPITSAWFKKMYKPTQFLLKERNLEGDKTLAIREILIDHDLNTEDRDLDYEIVEKTKLIKIAI